MLRFWLYFLQTQPKFINQRRQLVALELDQRFPPTGSQRQVDLSHSRSFSNWLSFKIVVYRTISILKLFHWLTIVLRYGWVIGGYFQIFEIIKS